ncbi:hypothetical protein SUGI_0124440 [Cryptomeria japonica]|nr:hypothetical protein SUGI_0124440 [Cryptomeria japonica]
MLEEIAKLQLQLLENEFVVLEIRQVNIEQRVADAATLPLVLADRKPDTTWGSQTMRNRLLVQSIQLTFGPLCKLLLARISSRTCKAIEEGALPCDHPTRSADGAQASTIE